MITVYSKEGCVFCGAAKSLLEFKEIDHKVISVPEDIDYGVFMDKYPGTKSFPLILEDENEIGGFKELQKYLLEKEIGEMSL